MKLINTSKMIPAVGILLTRLIVVYANCDLPLVFEHTTNDLTGDSPYPEGRVVEYTCDIGYLFSGYSRTYRCEGGTWKGEKFRCVEKLCAFLDPPDNGFISGKPDYTIASYLNFACHPGYDFKGDAKLRCRIDGWTPKLSRQECVPKNCGEFGDIENGEKFQEAPDGVYNDYGSEVFVSCFQGYTLSGTAKVTCNASGQWGQKPDCKPFQCNDYPGLNTSCIEKAYLADPLIYIECIKDQHKVTKTGQKDYAACFHNEWSEKDIGCFCNCNCNSTGANVVFNNCNSGGYVQHGEQLVWQCNEGSSKQSTGPIQCLDGKMSREPVCLLEKCGDFGEVPNGKTTPKFKFGVNNSVGSIIEIQCGKGYTITGGSPRVKCKPNRSWESKPQCVKTQCPTYSVPSSQCVDKLDYNTETGILALQCTVEANPSVTRIGPNSTKCVIDKWEDETMACYCDCKLKSHYDGVILDSTNNNGTLLHGLSPGWHCEYPDFYSKSSDDIKCNDGKLTSEPECQLSTVSQVGIVIGIALSIFITLCILQFCCSVWVLTRIKEKALNRRKTVWFCIKCGACRALKHEKRPFTRCCGGSSESDGKSKEELKEETPLTNTAVRSEETA